MWVAGDVFSQVSCHEPGERIVSAADGSPDHKGDLLSLVELSDSVRGTGACNSLTYCGRAGQKRNSANGGQRNQPMHYLLRTGREPSRHDGSRAGKPARTRHDGCLHALIHAR